MWWIIGLLVFLVVCAAGCGADQSDDVNYEEYD